MFIVYYLAHTDVHDGLNEAQRHLVQPELNDCVVLAKARFCPRFVATECTFIAVDAPSEALTTIAAHVFPLPSVHDVQQKVILHGDEVRQWLRRFSNQTCQGSDCDRSGCAWPLPRQVAASASAAVAVAAAAPFTTAVANTKPMGEKRRGLGRTTRVRAIAIQGVDNEATTAAVAAAIATHDDGTSPPIRPVLLATRPAPFRMHTHSNLQQLRRAIPPSPSPSPSPSPHACPNPNLSAENMRRTTSKTQSSINPTNKERAQVTRLAPPSQSSQPPTSPTSRSRRPGARTRHMDVEPTPPPPLPLPLPLREPRISMHDRVRSFFSHIP